MNEERTESGREVELRPRGFGRWFAAAFLSFWLCGWAAGQAFAVWFLWNGAVSLLTGEPPEPGREPVTLGPALAVGAFLLVWITIWTIGGVGAIRELLRLTVARDRVIAGPASLIVVRRLGPFRSRVEIPRDSLRRVYVVPGRGALTAETETGPVRLSALGTPAEREEVAALLAGELRLADRDDTSGLPDGWQEIVDPEGGIALVGDLGTRRKQARVATALTLIAGASATALLLRCRIDPALIPLTAMACTAAAGLAWGAARLTWGRLEWRIGSGEVVLRRRFGARVHDRFRAASLEITATSDSDGDDWFRLDAVAADAAALSPRHRRRGRRTIATSLHDPATPRRLGRWLAGRAAMPLTDESSPEFRTKDLERMKTELRNSGRFGRVAVGWIERLESRKLR